MRKGFILFFLLAIVLAFSNWALAERPWYSAEYVGSATCQPCHSGIYDSYYEEATHSKTVQPAQEAFPQIPKEVWETQAAAAYKRAVADLREKGVSVLSEELPSYEDVAWTMGGHLSPGEYQIFFMPVETEYGNSYVTIPVRWEGAYSEGYGDDLDPYSSPEDVGTYRERDWQRCFECHTGNYEYAEGGLFIDELPEEQRTDPTTGIVMSDWGWKTPEFEWGVPCETCHGPGSLHLEQPTADTIYGPAEGIEDDMLICQRCHTRGSSEWTHMEIAWDRGDYWTEKDGEYSPTEERPLGFPYGYMPGDEDIPEDYHLADELWDNWYFTGHFPRGHGQWLEYTQDTSYIKDYGKYTEGDEFVLPEYQEPRHAEYASCVDCHSVHDAGETKIRGQGSLVYEGNDVCTQCHSQEAVPSSPVKEMYAGTGGYGVADNPDIHYITDTSCIDCHMPQVNYPLRSHRFAMIEPDISWSGPQRYEDSPPITNRGRGRSMASRPGTYMINSCQNAACHTFTLVEETENAMDKDYWDGDDPQVLQYIWDVRQEYVAERLAIIENLLEETEQAKHQEAYQKAEHNYNFIVNDGSLGIHNYAYTIELLDYSQKVLEGLKEEQMSSKPIFWTWLTSLLIR